MAERSEFPGVDAKNGRIRIRLFRVIQGARQIIEIYPESNAGIPTQTNLEGASRLRKQILSDVADKSTQFNKAVIEKKYLSKAKVELAADSFGAVAAKWFEWAQIQCANGKKGFKHSTLDGDKQALNNLWIPLFGDKSVNKIEYEEIRTAIRGAEFKHFSEKTLKNKITSIKKIFDFADAELDIPIKPNPATDMTYPARLENKERALPYRPIEIEAIFKELEKETLQVRVYFTMFRGMGMRTSEILALEWNDIEGDEIWVTKGIVRGRTETETKTWTNRKVYMQPQVVDLLNQLKKERNTGVIPFDRTDHIFLNQKDKEYQDARVFNAAWHRAVENAQLDRDEAKALYGELKRRGYPPEQIKPYLSGRIPFRIPYKLRHTRASELISRGAQDDGPVQLGHSPEMFFRIYAQQIKEYEGKDKDRSKLISEERIS